MNDILKQRLVGALVIIALGVIFWPVIFNDPTAERLDRTSQVPRIPSLKKVPLQAPTPLAKVAPVRSVNNEAAAAPSTSPSAQSPVAASAAPTQPPPPAAAGKQAEPVAAKPSLDKDGIPIAWVLQVVTVSKKAKAEALVEELITLGYKAYFKPLKQGDATLYRVYLGPKFDRDSMQAAKRVVDKKLSVNSIIARYLP